MHRIAAVHAFMRSCGSSDCAKSGWKTLRSITSLILHVRLGNSLCQRHIRSRGAHTARGSACGHLYLKNHRHVLETDKVSLYMVLPVSESLLASVGTREVTSMCFLRSPLIVSWHWQWQHIALISNGMTSCSMSKTPPYTDIGMSHCHESPRFPPM